MPRRFSVLLSLLLVAIFVAIFFLDRQSTAIVTFENGSSIRVEVVRTSQDQSRGLAGHAPLTDDQGMLFVWGEPAIHDFWMKGMTFPIDIIWIRDGIIVGITPDVPPPSSGAADLPHYSSPEPVDTILEVAAGLTNRRGAEVGQAITVKP